MPNSLLVLALLVALTRLVRTLGDLAMQLTLARAAARALDARDAGRSVHVSYNRPGLGALLGRVPRGIQIDVVATAGPGWHDAAGTRDGA